MLGVEKSETLSFETMGAGENVSGVCQPWQGDRRLAFLFWSSCTSHIVYAPQRQAFEDLSPAEILPWPWADSALPSAPEQLMCEKQQLLGP